MIFVQIAAYRDPELLPTVVDCISKAKYPKDLRFGICWQRGPEDRSMLNFRDDSRFRIDAHLSQDGKGLCWARSRIQDLYAGEEYTLQLDSHHRFIPNWDEVLLNYLELTGSSKPILTTYGAAYQSNRNGVVCMDPYKIVAQGFTPSGTIILHPKLIPEWRDLTRPQMARFVSGHFFFTLGSHCHDYKCDPNLYFNGEEISLSIRSFTLGYDLFQPHRIIVWHDYSRQGRRKHWDDHFIDERDAVSKRRLRKLLGEEINDEDISQYDLGKIRSHNDYEKYAGIDFWNRRLQSETLLGCEPPCTFVDELQWESSFVSERRISIKWDPHQFDDCKDCHFIYFGLSDISGTEIFRHDAPSESPEALGLVDSKDIVFMSASKPVKLTVWPVSRSRGWLEKRVYNL